MGTVYFPGCKFENQWPESNRQLKDAVFERGWADRTTGCCKDEELDVSPDERVLCVCPSCVALLQRRLPDNEIVSVWSLIADDDTFPLPDYQGARLAMHNCEIFRDTGTSEAVHKVAARMNLELVDYPNDEVHIVEPEENEEAGADADADAGTDTGAGAGNPGEMPPHGGQPGDGRPPHMSFLGHFDRSRMPQRPDGAQGRPGGFGGHHGAPGGGFGGHGTAGDPVGHHGAPGRPNGGHHGGAGRPGGDPNGRGGLLDMMPQADKQAIKDYCDKMEGDEVVCFCTGCHAGLQASDKNVVNFIELVFPPNNQH